MIRVIELPQIRDPRGALSVIESGEHVEWEIRRVYYLYDVPGGAIRAGHAHRDLRQLLIAVSGSFDVLVDDGNRREVVTLNRSYVALEISPMVWREISNFSSGAVCLALASIPYSEADYIRDYEDFQRMVVS